MPLSLTGSGVQSWPCLLSHLQPSHSMAGPALHLGRGSFQFPVVPQLGMLPWLGPSALHHWGGLTLAGVHQPVALCHLSWEPCPHFWEWVHRGLLWSLHKRWEARGRLVAVAHLGSGSAHLRLMLPSLWPFPAFGELKLHIARCGQQMGTGAVSCIKCSISFF